jgi:hypothetical protein
MNLSPNDRVRRCRPALHHCGRNLRRSRRLRAPSHPPAILGPHPRVPLRPSAAKPCDAPKGTVSHPPTLLRPLGHHAAEVHASRCVEQHHRAETWTLLLAHQRTSLPLTAWPALTMWMEQELVLVDAGPQLADTREERDLLLPLAVRPPLASYWVPRMASRGSADALKTVAASACKYETP